MEKSIIFYKHPILKEKGKVIFVLKVYNDYFKYFKECDEYQKIKNYIIKYKDINSDGFTLEMIGVNAIKYITILPSRWEDEPMLNNNTSKITYCVDNVFFEQVKNKIIDTMDNIEYYI